MSECRLNVAWIADNPDRIAPGSKVRWFVITQCRRDVACCAEIVLLKLRDVKAAVRFYIDCSIRFKG